MLKHRYSPKLATSVVAASGAIGSMIPPSLTFVIYGWYTGAPIGVGLLSKFLALAGLPSFLASYVDTTNPYPRVVIAFMLALYLLLGGLDPIGIILITLPVLMPLFKAVNLDLIWMGVLVIKMIEMGLLTPPSASTSSSSRHWWATAFPFRTPFAA